jgi:hypothetical protein
MLDYTPHHVVRFEDSVGQICGFKLHHLECKVDEVTVTVAASVV